VPRAIANWPDIVFASDWRNATLTAATNAGRLRRIGHGVYTPSADADDVVVRRNWMAALGHALPGAVVVDGSARSGIPDPSGRLYVDHSRRSPYVLPGLAVIPRRGPGPLPGDTELDEFYLSSPARGMLDNLSRVDSRRLTRSEVERWVVDIVTQHGDERGEQQRKAPRVEGRAERRPARRLDGEAVLVDHPSRIAIEQSVRLTDVERPIVTPPMARPVRGEHDRRSGTHDQRQRCGRHERGERTQPLAGRGHDRVRTVRRRYRTGGRRRRRDLAR
jgi:hypothetical protein